MVQLQKEKKQRTAKKAQIVRQRRMFLFGVVLIVLLVIMALFGARYPITRRELRQFGWKGDTSLGAIYQLNHLLRQYHITSSSSLTMFFATAAAETGYGRLTLEEGGEAYYQKNGYNAQERGAGYLQMTHREEQLAFLQAMGDNFTGEDTASYIAKNYPWESACWEWSVGKTAPQPNPNGYAKERGNTEEVFLATQYAINGWRIEDEALRAIVQGAEYTMNQDATVLTINGQTAPTPRNWDDRLEAYHKAKEIWG